MFITFSTVPSGCHGPTLAKSHIHSPLNTLCYMFSPYEFFSTSCSNRNLDCL